MPKNEVVVEVVEEDVAPGAPVYGTQTVYGNDWHVYAPRARAYVKHDLDDPGKVHVYLVGVDEPGTSNTVDELEFLAEWAPSTDAKASDVA